jgi:putative serine protease PepD
MNRRSVSDPLLLASGILLALSTRVSSAPADPLISRLPAVVASAIREKSPAIVSIRIHDAQGSVSGTGFHLDPAGTVCTAADLVREGSDLRVTDSQGEWSACVVAVDPRSGTAFLRINDPQFHGTPSFLSPGKNDYALPFTPVLGMASGMERKPVASLGMLTGSEIRDGDRYFCVPHLTARFPEEENAPGSPVIDLAGNLMGMIVGGDGKASRILPSSALDKLHRDLLRHGRISSGWIGAVVEECAVPEGGSKTRIAALEPGSPAESAGVKEGDMLLAIGGKPIRNPEETLGVSFYLCAGEEVKLSLLRAGQPLSLTVRCSETPGSRQPIGGTFAPSSTEMP